MKADRGVDQQTVPGGRWLLRTGAHALRCIRVLARKHSRCRFEVGSRTTRAETSGLNSQVTSGSPPLVVREGLGRGVLPNWLLQSSNHPPAKPGAFDCEPLKAADVEPLRGAVSLRGSSIALSYLPVIARRIVLPRTGFADHPTHPHRLTPTVSSPVSSLLDHSHRPGHTPGAVKLLLPPRQSRGVSRRTSAARCRRC